MPRNLLAQALDGLMREISADYNDMIYAKADRSPTLSHSSANGN
jgi:hypothetical protein